MNGAPAGADAVDCGLLLRGFLGTEKPLAGLVTAVLVEHESVDIERVEIGCSTSASRRLLKLFLCFRCFRQLNSSSICGSYGGGWSSFDFSSIGAITTESLE